MLTVESIRQDFNGARKQGDHITRQALEAVITELLVKEKSSNQFVIDESVIISCIEKELKVLNEQKDSYVKSGRSIPLEITNKEDVLKKYLPKQLTESEVISILQEICNKNNIVSIDGRSKGTIMKEIIPLISGKFDKGKLNQLISTLRI